MYDQHLESFVKVADEGSFSAAAAPMHISPNALIKHVNLLEKRLGVRLFDRSNAGVALTEAGESIYADAKKLMAFANDAIERAQAKERIARTVIRIGTSPLRPCKMIVDLWDGASKNRPDIHLQVVPFDDARATWNATLEHLGESVDVIAGTYAPSFWGGRCNVLHIRQSRLCCAVPRNHALTSKERLTFDDLQGQTLIMVERGDTPYIDALRDDIAANHPKITVKDMPGYDTQTFNKALDQGGLLITVQEWESIHPSFVTLPVEWEFSVPVGVMYALHPSKAVQDFIAVLKTEVASRSPEFSDDVRRAMLREEAKEYGLLPDDSFDASEMPDDILDMLGVTADEGAV